MLNGIFQKGVELYDKTEDKISKIKDKALEYVPEIDIDKIERELIKIGYNVPRVEIAITIPPRIAFEIDLNKSKVNEAKKETLLKENEDIHEDQDNITNRALVKIIQGLDAAIKLKDKLKFKDKELSRVSVEGSMIPTIKLIYLSKEEQLIEERKDNVV